MTQTLLWKPDWPQARENLIGWWRHKRLALSLVAARSAPIADQPMPAEPPDIESWWTDPLYRVQKAEAEMACRAYLAEAFPYFDTQVGPGSLGIILGARPVFDRETVWYEPGIFDPQAFGAIRFDPVHNPWFDRHMALLEIGMHRAQGRYLVGVPDLIENMDTLAALRGSQPLLVDLLERPGWVHERLAEINQAYFQVFDRMYSLLHGESYGNAFAAFAIWGPGRTAKLQCDFSAMISPKMFAEFVLPYLSEQCRWLDFSLYHLDGTTALQHLDLMLSIEDLDAIEWTPQAGKPGGGSPEWYDLYRRIKSGGKSVEAVGVAPDEVVPLLDAVGPQGMMVQINGVVSEKRAEALLREVEPYRL